MPRAGMRVCVLMYHDFELGDGDPSRFGHPGADRYWIGWEQFCEHLDRIADATGTAPETAGQLLSGEAADGGWAITFDDGGASAAAAGEELARRGWRGHFFITTDWLGRPGFLDVPALRELHAAGHVIGSHSCSHPAGMDRMRWAPLAAEWRRSVEVLGDALGEPIACGAVPGGYYSERVGRAAAAAGIRALFTSRPVTRVAVVDGCAVLGRFAVRRHVDAGTAAALAQGRTLPALRERATWTSREAVRRPAPGLYLRLRSTLLAAGQRGRRTSHREARP